MTANTVSLQSALTQVDLYNAAFCFVQLVAAMQKDMHIKVLHILQGTAKETATSYSATKACTAVNLTMSSTACIAPRPDVHYTILPTGLYVDIECANHLSSTQSPFQSPYTLVVLR